MLQSFTNSIQHRCTAIMTLIYDYLAFTVTAKEKSTKFKKNGDHFSAGDPLKRILQLDTNSSSLDLNCLLIGDMRRTRRRLGAFFKEGGSELSRKSPYYITFDVYWRDQDQSSNNQLAKALYIGDYFDAQLLTTPQKGQGNNNKKFLFIKYIISLAIVFMPNIGVYEGYVQLQQKKRQEKMSNLEVILTPTSNGRFIR